jgi:hypothetical protein
MEINKLNKSFSINNIINLNRKFHIYAGLFLLLFILFFSLSGLVLNHSQWKFASFWNERKVTEIIAPLTMPINRDSASLLHNFMKQLDISGEISNVSLTPDSIDFRVMKPGTIWDIHIDFKNRMGYLKKIVFNLWGKMRILHTFNGSDKENPAVQPNWIVTRFWRLSMDAVASGLIVLCMGGWIMWYKIRKDYSMGLIVLILGLAGAIFFVFLLRLL